MTDQRFLRRKTRPDYETGAEGTLRVVDLFCGCGGMSLGAAEAARAARMAFEVALAVDQDEEAGAVYKENLAPVEVRSVDDLFDGELGDQLTPLERRVRKRAALVHVLLGGPPCQGNSDLNNHTRRIDPRNRLYARMARAAFVLRPASVLIENVPAVRHDRGEVVTLTRRALTDAGYSTWEGVLALSDLGIPQRRRRHFLLASRVGSAASLIARVRPFKGVRSLRWACGDLAGSSNCDAFNTAGLLSDENRKRVDWLFDHDAFDLPDELRPPCHRDGGHSYRSVYGRMHWDKPSQTVTTGFGSMGQGRYVHPSQRRTITPHEAARLQTFPDFFDFGAVAKRTAWSRLVGNAVPPLAVARLLKPIVNELRDAHVTPGAADHWRAPR